MTQPTLTREGIATALFALLKTVPGVLTFTRIWENFDKVDKNRQPWLCMSKGDEKVQQFPDGRPPIWKYEYLITLYCYQQSSDKSLPPSVQANDILDAVEATLRPVPGGPPGFPDPVQVLGDETGVIRHAWMGDSVMTDEGVLTPQSFIVFPIEIKVVQ